MWIGDWDRHEDQWRWSETKTKDGDRTFTAVPEDRDIAFFKGDGVLPYLISAASLPCATSRTLATTTPTTRA